MVEVPGRVLLVTIFSSYSHFVEYSLILLLLYVLWKFGFFARMWQALRQNLLFFTFLYAAVGCVLAFALPWIPFLHADELLYMDMAQDITLYQRNAFCYASENGFCTGLAFSELQFGPSSVYSLLYNQDYRTFYERLVAFNLILFLLNGLLVFLLAEALSKSATVARVSAILFLFVPSVIAYARSAIPDMAAASFLLISAVSFTGLHSRREKRVQASLTMIVGLTVLSSWRAEYAALLCIASAAFFLLWLRKPRAVLRRWKHAPPSEKVISALAVVGVLTVLMFVILAYIPSRTSAGAIFSLHFLQTSYLSVYLYPAAMTVLSVCFAVYLLYALVVRRHSVERNRALVSVFAACFLFYLGLYSFYWTSDLRFLLPVTPLYIVVAASGIVAVLQWLPWKGAAAVAAIIVATVLAGSLVLAMARERASLQFADQCAGQLVDLVSGIQGLTHNDSSVFVLADAPFVAHLVGVKNFAQSDSFAFSKMQQGFKILYVGYVGPAGAIPQLQSFPKQNYSFTELDGNNCGQRVYHIEEKRQLQEAR